MSKLKYYDGTEWKTVNGQVTGDTLPIGAIIPYGSTTAPVNWLVCDGSAVSRTTYADLFSVIGTTYGSGDGSTTFNLPNLKGRVAVGQDTNDTDFDTIGETGGSKELQEHFHTIGNSAGAGSTSAWGIPSEYNSNMGSFNTGSAGYGNSGNLQPYQVVCYIIKVSQSSGLIANVSNTQSDSQTDTYSCDYINGDILYSDDTGTIDDITLSNSINNYRFVEIFYNRNNKGYASSKVEVNSNSLQNISLISSYFDANIWRMYVRNITINGANLTNITQNSFGVNFYTSPSSVDVGYSDTYFRITKVIGYK